MTCPDRYSFQPNCYFDKYVVNRGNATVVVFINKEQHGSVKCTNIMKTSFFCALSFKMNNSGATKIIVFETSLLNPITQVHIFPIHEESFIKRSNGIQHISADHHKCAG